MTLECTLFIKILDAVQTSESYFLIINCILCNCCVGRFITMKDVITVFWSHLYVLLQIVFSWICYTSAVLVLNLPVCSACGKLSFWNWVNSQKKKFLYKVQWSSTRYTEPRSGETVVVAPNSTLHFIEPITTQVSDDRMNGSLDLDVTFRQRFPGLFDKLMSILYDLNEVSELLLIYCD